MTTQDRLDDQGEKISHTAKIYASYQIWVILKTLRKHIQIRKPRRCRSVARWDPHSNGQTRNEPSFKFTDSEIGKSLQDLKKKIKNTCCLKYIRLEWNIRLKTSKLRRIEISSCVI